METEYLRTMAEAEHNQQALDNVARALLFAGVSKREATKFCKQDIKLSFAALTPDYTLNAAATDRQFIIRTITDPGLCEIMISRFAPYTEKETHKTCALKISVTMQAACKRRKDAAHAALQAAGAKEEKIAKIMTLAHCEELIFNAAKDAAARSRRDAEAAEAAGEAKRKREAEVAEEDRLAEEDVRAKEDVFFHALDDLKRSREAKRAAEDQGKKRRN
jgi:hypothetical protein